jgi:hypothetical protein
MAAVSYKTGIIEVAAGNAYAVVQENAYRVQGMTLVGRATTMPPAEGR